MRMRTRMIALRKVVMEIVLNAEMNSNTFQFICVWTNCKDSKFHLLAVNSYYCCI